MPKKITSTSRLTNQLERMIRALIHDFFNDVMPMPIVTCVPSARAYAHYTVAPVWNVGCGEFTQKHEINISSAYLMRGLEYITASALHELVHYYCDTVLNVQDTSNRGVYHNHKFKEEAEKHGLICNRSEKYGFSDTSSVLSDELLDWVLLHDEFREIELNRTIPGMIAMGVGPRSADGGALPTSTTKPSSTRKLVCPCCKQSVRATRTVNILCGDCMVKMVET